MGLLNTYGDANKVTYRGLAIRYSVEPDGDESQQGLVHYTVTRYATKSYAYVGMDYATASNCASAKRTQYTRKYSRLYGGQNGQQTEIKVTMCPADIAPQHDAGDMWSVQIDVSETDQKTTNTNPTNPASLFAEANSRNYDDYESGAPSIVLNHVTYAMGIVFVSYDQNIPDFVNSDLVLQYRDSEAGEWQSSYYPWNDFPQPTGDRWCQLKYGDIISNVVKMGD